MNGVGALILLILLCFVGFGSRRLALIGMVAGVLYLTQGQVIDVGVHLFAIRILGMVLFLRVMIRNEFHFRNLNRIDQCVLMLYVFITSVFLIRSATGQAAAIAEALDACCCYFGLRGLIKGEEDFRWLLRAMVVLLVPYAFLIAVERVRGSSAFLFMGGLTAGWTREGATRCMGSFRYAVTLGTFAASFLPLYMALWASKPDRVYAYAGIGLCSWIVFASNSGGSISAAIVALVGWGFWYIRDKMRLVRWAIVTVIAALALIMKAPVWFILNQVSFGGDSWHRAYLIDVAMRHIGKWWFAGMAPEQTASWFPYTINGAADITNQYLSFGISAGIGAIALFILLLSRVFGRVGMVMAKLERQGAGSKTVRFMVWGLGATTTVHVISWFGVSYFDQIYVIWFLELAALTSITEHILHGRDQYSPQRISSRESRTPPQYVGA